jgi:uncharacterized protein (DUF58 family)
MQLKRGFVVALAGALLVALCAPAAGAGKLDFIIELSAPAYTAGHPIPLRLTLANASAPVRVNTRLAVNDANQPPAFREVTVAIRKPSGRQAAFVVDIKIGAAPAAKLVLLPAGRTVSRTIDLARYYALDEHGVYEVRATYASAAPNTVAGPVASNTARFTLH